MCIHNLLLKDVIMQLSDNSENDNSSSYCTISGPVEASDSTAMPDMEVTSLVLQLMLSKKISVKMLL